MPKIDPLSGNKQNKPKISLVGRKVENSSTVITSKVSSKRIPTNNESEEEERNKAFAEVRDIPTKQDLLGFKRWADYVTEFISRDFSRDSKEATQITIGIYGEWGSGKTSFLRMIEMNLQKRDIYPIWFDAWEYDKEDNLWAALLQKILDQAKVRGNWYRRVWVKFIIWKDQISLRDGLWEVTKRILPLLVRILLIFISLYIVLGLDKKTIETFLSQWLPNNPAIPSSFQANIVKAIGAFIAIIAAGPFNLINLLKGKLGIDFSKFSHKPNYREHIAFLDEFTKEFKKIVRLIGQGKPLVIIIDDLDRCLPEKAIQVIEAIKALLDVEGCVFLLGLDREIIGRAVAAKYKDLFFNDDDKNETFQKRKSFYEDYLDKIIQLAIFLPHLNQTQIEKFITNLSTHEDIIHSARIFGTGSSPNPRKIKQLLRSFLFVRDLMNEDIRKGSIITSILAKIIIIQYQLPDIFKAFVEKPSLLGELEKFYRMQTEGGGQTQQPNHSDQLHEEENLLRALAEKYATNYPKLTQILLTKVDETDTLIGVDMNRYIDLIGVLAVVRPLTSDTYRDTYRSGVPFTRASELSRHSFRLGDEVAANFPYITAPIQDVYNAAIQALLTSTKRGSHKHGILILGEANAGKTRLAYEVLIHTLPDWPILVWRPDYTIDQVLTGASGLYGKHLVIFIDDLQDYVSAPMKNDDKGGLTVDLHTTTLRSLLEILYQNFNSVVVVATCRIEDEMRVRAGLGNLFIELEVLKLPHFNIDAHDPVTANIISDFLKYGSTHIQDWDGTLGSLVLGLSTKCSEYLRLSISYGTAATILRAMKLLWSANIQVYSERRLRVVCAEVFGEKALLTDEKAWQEAVSQLVRIGFVMEEVDKVSGEVTLVIRKDSYFDKVITDYPSPNRPHQLERDFILLKQVLVELRDADALVSLGGTLANLNRHTEAIEVYDQAIEFDPHLARAYTNKGIELNNLKRLEEALAAYEQAILIDPNDAAVYHSKGLVLSELGKQREAEQAYEKARQLGYED